MTPQQPELVDLYRAGLKGAVDLMKTTLENAERLQNQQLIAIRRALDAHASAAAELARAQTMDELLAVHTRMAGAQVERMVGYWSSLYEQQMSALGQMQWQFAQARQWLDQAAAQTQASLRQAEDATARAAASSRRETSAAR